MPRTETTIIHGLHWPHKSRDGLFKILNKISCPQRLLKIVQLFHGGNHNQLLHFMKGVVQFDDSYSGTFSICISVKQGYVFAPTLFSIFTIMLKHAFGDSTETDGIYLYTWTNRRLFSLSQLRVKSKVCEVLIIETCCLQTMQHCQHVWRATAASNGQFFKSLPRVQFDHQSEEDQCNGPRHWTASCRRRL